LCKEAVDHIRCYLKLSQFGALVSLIAAFKLYPSYSLEVLINSVFKHFAVGMEI